MRMVASEERGHGKQDTHTDTERCILQPGHIPGRMQVEQIAGCKVCALKTGGAVGEGGTVHAECQNTSCVHISQV